MNTYAFETKDGCRIDVLASSIKLAHNKAKSIPFIAEKLTGFYYKYDSDGFHCNYNGWDGHINFNKAEGK